MVGGRAIFHQDARRKHLSGQTPWLFVTGKERLRRQNVQPKSCIRSARVCVMLFLSWRGGGGGDGGSRRWGGDIISVGCW